MSGTNVAVFQRDMLFAAHRHVITALVAVVCAGCAPAPSLGGPGFDPLSIPAQPTLSADQFPTAADDCSACHAQKVAEWRTSQHAQSMQNPVFQALVTLERRDNPEDRFCFQCHSPIGTRSWDIGAAFTFAAMTPITREGVTCTVCHRVSAVVRPDDAGVVLDPADVAYGPIADPLPVAHAQRDAPWQTQPLLCGACHDVFVPQTQLWLETPYKEWTQASQGRSENAAPLPTCQECHMPLSQGPAADGGPMRPLHSHRFVGADVLFAGSGLSDSDVQDSVAARLLLLQTSGQVLLNARPGTLGAGQPLWLEVAVRNLVAGHRLPTGSTFNRELWLAVRVTDDAGHLLYQSGPPSSGDGPAPPTGTGGGSAGQLACDGDPATARDTGEPVTFQGRLLDRQGQPTPFPWRAVAFDNSAALQPLETRSFTVKVQTEPTDAFPLHLSAALCFRSYAPATLGALGLATLRNQDETVVIDQAVMTFPSGGP